MLYRYYPDIFISQDNFHNNSQANSQDDSQDNSQEVRPVNAVWTIKLTVPTCVSNYFIFFLYLFIHSFTLVCCDDQ